ncbi:MAG: MFS transporter [Treponemataceae bacterium]|nr:MFS transporter [Treponemataceae bacterium]
MKKSAGKGFWTVRYTLLNATYFAAFCTIHACAAVFLLANGFTNTQVGLLLAVANIVSAIFQPFIAGIIDKPGALTNRRFILISVLVILFGAVILLFVQNNKALIFIIYALIYMVQFAYQPVMTALCFEYQKAGCNIQYGLSRGLGSASFAVTSAFIGAAVEQYGVSILMVVTIVLMLLSAVIIISFKKPSKAAGALADDVCEPATGEQASAICGESAAEEPVAGVLADAAPGEAMAAPGSENLSQGNSSLSPLSARGGFIGFAKAYPAFMLYLLAAVCFFFAHNMINDFMIQIIRSLGGGEKELGYSNFLQAILELPVMALIGLVLKRISARRLLVFSGLAFFVKPLILVFASNMAMMYLSQSFQLFAYAVFIPAAAYYVSQTMKESDQVKGQAYVTSAITLGGVFSNFICGAILDNFGILPMLLTGTVVCAVGVLLGFIAMERLPHRR